MRTAIDAFHEVQRQVPDAALLLVGPVIDQSETEKVLSAGSRLQCFTYLGKWRQLRCAVLWMRRMCF